MRFSAVYRVGGSKSLTLFTPETGVGLRAKSRSFKRVAKYTVESIGITEVKNRLFGDASVDLRIQG